MLTDGKPILYWDACVPLSYINGYADRLPDIEGLMQKSGKDFHIITSILSITEVAFAQVEQGQKVLDPAQEERINKLWRKGSPIQLVELFQIIAEDARALMRAAITKSWSLKPADALHLATADHYKVAQFHTYDSALEKYKEITKTHFPIGPPKASQPVLIMPPSAQKEEPSKPTAPEGLPDAEKSEQAPAPAAAGTAEESDKLQADPAHPVPVQGGDGGRAQDEAAGEAGQTKTQEE